MVLFSVQRLLPSNKLPAISSRFSIADCKGDAKRMNWVRDGHGGMLRDGFFHLKHENNVKRSTETPWRDGAWLFQGMRREPLCLKHREPCRESHDWDWRNGCSMTPSLTKPDLWLGHYWLLLEMSIPCPVFLTMPHASSCSFVPSKSAWQQMSERHWDALLPQDGASCNNLPCWLKTTLNSKFLLLCLPGHPALDLDKRKLEITRN